MGASRRPSLTGAVHAHHLAGYEGPERAGEEFDDARHLAADADVRQYLGALAP